MHMVTKYQYESLRIQCMDVMMRVWPRTLDQWLRERQTLAEMREQHKHSRSGMYRDKFFNSRVPDPALAIRFAEDFDVPEILPAAYYTLAGISHDHQRRPDNDEGIHALAFDLVRTAAWEVLTGEDIIRFAEGRRRLRDIVQEINRLYTEDVDALREEVVVPSRCRGRRAPDCFGNFSSVVESWKGGILSVQNIATQMAQPDPLGWLCDLYDDNAEWPICGECCLHLKNHIRQQQEEIWYELAHIFNLNHAEGAI